MNKIKTDILPIWKIIVENNLYYFVLGITKKIALETLKNNGFDHFNKFVSIKPISIDDAHKILLQVDIEDEEYTTLFEEAKYYSDHHLSNEFPIATNFDIIADMTLNHHFIK